MRPGKENNPEWLQSSRNLIPLADANLMKAYSIFGGDVGKAKLLFGREDDEEKEAFETLGAITFNMLSSVTLFQEHAR